MLSSWNHANGWTNDLKRNTHNRIQNNLPIVPDRSTIVIMPTSGRSSSPVAKPAIFSELSTISWMEAKLIITDSMTMAIGSNFVRPEKQINNVQQEELHCHLNCRINGVTKFIEKKMSKNIEYKVYWEKMSKNIEYKAKIQTSWPILHTCAWIYMYR